MWRSLVSRLVRVQEASGSNPDTPTKLREATLGGLSYFIGIREPEVSCISIIGHRQMRIAQSASGSNPDTPTKLREATLSGLSYFIGI